MVELRLFTLLTDVKNNKKVMKEMKVSYLIYNQEAVLNSHKCKISNTLY